MRCSSFVDKLKRVNGKVRGPLAKWISEADPDAVKQLNEAIKSWKSGELPQFSSAAALLRGMQSVDGRFSGIDRCQFTLYSKQ